MNRTTLYALVAFVALLAAVLVMRYAPEGVAPPALSLPGWSAEAAPFDEIRLRRGGDSIVLVKKGAEDWDLTAPIEAAADTFKVKAIFSKLAEPLESSLSKRVAPEDLRAFKLDDKSRVALTLLVGGEVVLDLVVGGLETAEVDPASGLADADTWVMKAGEEDRAYRLPGVDLRSGVDKAVADLRSKKLFRLKSQDVRRVVIEDPSQGQYPRIELVGEAAAEEGGESRWRFESPKGYEAGEVRAYVGPVLSAHATEFLPADDPEGKAALGEGAVRIALASDDEELRLTVGQPGERFGYLRVEGRDEIVKLSKHSIERMRASLSDLRNKDVFPVSPEAITRVALNNAEGHFEFARQEGGWVAQIPRGLALDDKPMRTFLRELSQMKVTDFVGQLPPEETGLGSPSRKVVVEAAGAVHTLLLGQEKDAKVFGTLAGVGGVFTLSAWSAKKLDKKAADFQAAPAAAPPAEP